MEPIKKVNQAKLDWIESHKDHIKLYNANYYQKHKEKQKQMVGEKAYCQSCGCYVNKCHLSRHTRTQKHILRAC